MVEQIVVDAGELYERCERVSRAAVIGSPGTSYSLTGILDDEGAWEAIFATAFFSLIPVHATLDGCSQALNARGMRGARMNAVREPAPAGTLVSEDDMATARHWLGQVLENELGWEEQQLMIADHAIDNGYETNSARLSSLMLALVKTSDSAMDQ